MTNKKPIIPYKIEFGSIPVGNTLTKTINI